MTKFDFSRYKDSAPQSQAPSPLPQQPQKNTSSFDFSKYKEVKEEEPETDEIYKKYYKPREVSREEFKNMSRADQLEYSNDLQVAEQYLNSAGFMKQAISDLSFGFSERNDALKPKEGEGSKWLGSIAGSAPYFIGGFKLLEMGLKTIPATYKWGKAALRAAGAFDLGAQKELMNEVGKDEDIDPLRIALSGASVAIFDTLIQSVPPVYNWFKNLSEPQQEALVVKNLIPENLSPSDYKFYQDNVAPELQALGEQQYKQAYQKAVQENDLAFKQEMANVRGGHENDLYKIQHLEMDHAAKAKQIEEANRIVTQEFEAAKQEWDATVARENVVREALDTSNQRANTERPFRASEGGEDVGIRPEAPYPAQTPLEEQVGNIISRQSFPNRTVAGEQTTTAIRSSAKADQRQVARLYDISDAENAGISDKHPELANELRGIVDDLQGKGNITPEEKMLMDNAKKTLDSLIEFDEAGNAVGYKEVDNQFILEQAKALRQKMYFDYGESNSTGIFTPLLNRYQDAAREAAIAQGNTAAVQANEGARAAHREWVSLYKNRQIRKWRNLSSDKPTALYESSMNIDDYRQINRVLSRTNSGQNLSSQIRRDLVNKELGKFLENPRKFSLSEFNEQLAKLEPILQPGERAQFQSIFREGRRNNYLPARRIPRAEEPQAPKLKEPVEKKISQPTEVKIPTKKPVKATPEMKEASKLMKITEDEAMALSDKPSGLRELKSKLSETKNGNRIFEEISKRKIRDILYKGNVKKTYSGRELFDIINKQDNFGMLSEILGESETTQLLKAAEEIGNKNVTKENLLKVIRKAALIKTLGTLGFI